MKVFYTLIITILVSCNFESNKVDLNPLNKIEPINYEEVDIQVQEILQKNNGQFPIIKFEKTKGEKHLIYFGEQHGNDPKDSRFDSIQKYFYSFNPTILLNEGGQVADSIHFKTREEAIEKKGTIGFLKFLADEAKLKLQNADCPDSIEVASLVRKYEKNNVLYFLVMQRFIPQFIQGNNGAKDLDTAYQKFVNKYLTTRCKLTLTEKEKQWNYFEKIYAKNNKNKNLNLNNFDMLETEFTNEDFDKIKKSSMQIRDSIIINNIYNTFKNHNKVMIVFGAAHLLAQKPTLEKLFE